MSSYSKQNFEVLKKDKLIVSFIFSMSFYKEIINETQCLVAEV